MILIISVRSFNRTIARLQPRSFFRGCLAPPTVYSFYPGERRWGTPSVFSEGPGPLPDVVRPVVRDQVGLIDPEAIPLPLLYVKRPDENGRVEGQATTTESAFRKFFWNSELDEKVLVIRDRRIVFAHEIAGSETRDHLPSRPLEFAHHIPDALLVPELPGRYEHNLLVTDGNGLP